MISTVRYGSTAICLPQTEQPKVPSEPPKTLPRLGLTFDFDVDVDNDENVSLLDVHNNEMNNDDHKIMSDDFVTAAV